jgi:hypothetical protein
MHDWPLPRHRRGTFKQAADKLRNRREHRWFEERRALTTQIEILKKQLAALDARRCAGCGELDSHHTGTCKALAHAVAANVATEADADSG